MNASQIITMLPNASIEEIHFLNSLLEGKTDEDKNRFITIYVLQRKDPHLILTLTIVSFFCLGGIQRLFLDNILLGLIYFFTIGLCGVGTILDLINYKNITFEYNRKMAQLVYHSIDK